MSSGKCKGGGVYAFLGLSSPFDPNCTFVTSPVFPPFLLAAVRLLIAFYALFVVLFSLIWGAVRVDDAQTYFSFFTHLSYIGLLAYYWAAGVQTLVYATRGRYPLRKWYRPLQFLHTLLYSSVTTFPFVVTIAYWGILTSSSTFSNTFNSWNNVSVHAMNAGMALFEIIFANTRPLPWIHLPFNILFLACYLAVAYITHATQGFYPYNFLDPQIQHAKVAAYVFGIAIAEVIIFVVVHFLIRLRVRLSRRRSTASSSQEAIDEWEEVDRPNDHTA